MLLEQDAFDHILQDWQRQGYPFGHIVPSHGSAIGSSGDRPDALADLIGIILNNGYGCRPSISSGWNPPPALPIKPI
jgi:hypothetical protein